MQLTDLITGLAFVSGHIGLARLDRGLRDGIAIPTEELQAHATLLSRSAQIITVTNQIQQLKKQADSARKQQLNAQHAQLMVQVGQLQMQVQQLNTERQRLELEEKKELRLAQENRVMRMFVDLYEQAQTYRLLGQVLDFLVVVLAAFRLYRQIYHDLDDANNRLKLSDLRERLFNTVSELLRDGASREKLAEAYARSLQQPLSVLASGQQAQAQAISLLDTEHGKAEASSASWGQAASSAALGADQLQQARQALEAARRELGQLLGAHDLREFFFPLQPEQSGGLLVGLSSEWQAWVSAIETHSGQRLADVYKALDQLPGQLDQTLKQTETAIGHSKQNQLAYQLAEALSGLAAVVPGQRAHYQGRATQFKSLAIVPGTVNPAALLDNLYELRQIQANVIDGFGPLQRYLDQNRQGADQRYQAETTRRLQALSGAYTTGLTGLLPQVFGLYSEISKLNQAISSSIVAYWRQAQKAVATNDGFAQLRARAVQLADEAQIAEVDRLASAQPTGLANRLLASFKTQTQKVADQHVRWVEQFMQIYPPVASGAPANSHLLADLPPLPSLGVESSSKAIVPLSPARLSGLGRPAWVRVGGLGLILASFLCLCLFVGGLFSRPSTSVQATEVANAQVTESSHASNTASPSPTATPQPSSTASVTPTSSPTLSIVLPLTIASTNWKYVVEQVAAYEALGDGNDRIIPSLGRYLVLIGQLRNDGNQSECLTDREWELTNALSGEKFDYDFYAESRVRGLYAADPPGTFLGTCLGAGESKAVFVVFNVKTDAQLALVFHRSDGGQIVGLGTALTIAAAPMATATLSPTSTSTATATDTPAPTETPSPTQTVAPKTQTARAVLSVTARVAATRTERARPTATRTARPSPMPSPEPNYVPIAARIARGEKVYYGLGARKTYGFQILGGSEDCPSLPSGRGLVVLYPDGSIEWKDRGYIISSGLYFLRDDDPAIKALDWMDYSCQ